MNREFDPARVVDLRPLGGKDWKAVGLGHWLRERERAALRQGWWVLHREPRNRYDANAIAVYLDCRKIGYLSAAKARAYSPMLDALGADGYEVDARIAGIQVYVTLPTPAAVRALVTASHSED
ncbi:HIRAN domain-containing protein [Demequina sp. SYSU T00192]|uniref:HIRAN domain-containing protein n=1 Tax=Demequina litoralis TaxID=3051660 RepID=A0ABT8GBV5_9MICO|nr:HIRAN domain-containing protein [Demequina sp. SYSU T00192]MDN4476613.1 HIRAN domain-containing protein [Demequina sp. SYSU T00192]